MAAKAEIISATRALSPLRNQADNFILFESEVEKMISRLLEKYRSNQNSIETVRNSLLEVGLVIEQEVMLWLKKLHRRLSPRKKARNPWTVVVARDLPANIFGFIMEMIKKAVGQIVLCALNRIDSSEICLDFAKCSYGIFFKAMERSQERRSRELL